MIHPKFLFISSKDILKSPFLPLEKLHLQYSVHIFLAKEKELELGRIRSQLKDAESTMKHSIKIQHPISSQASTNSTAFPSDHAVHIALNELDSKWRRELHTQQAESTQVISRMNSKLEEHKQQAEHLQQTVRDLTKQLENEKLKAEVVVKESLLEVNKIRETAQKEILRSTEETNKVHVNLLREKM